MKKILEKGFEGFLATDCKSEMVRLLCAGKGEMHSAAGGNAEDYW